VSKIKRLIIKLLFRLLDSSLPIDYSKINKQAAEDWLWESFNSAGWRSYFAYEDLKILKQLRQGQPTEQYYMLIGRSIQLLYLFDAMREAGENKKSREKKRLAEAKKKREEEAQK